MHNIKKRTHDHCYNIDTRCVARAQRVVAAEFDARCHKDDGQDERDHIAGQPDADIDELLNKIDIESLWHSPQE
jgi:hypothetical protein